MLWFDESYDEVHYRFQSSLETAAETGLLITVGTSGATNLPNQVVGFVYDKGGMIIDINPERNPFSELAEKSAGGGFLQGSCTRILPGIAGILTG